MVGDSTDNVWGVIDAHVRTDFPDIRKKAVIQSKVGNILAIPREGGTLVRFYVEIPHHLQSMSVSSGDLQSTVRSILTPYNIEFVKVVWYSTYKVGQRYADHFHKDRRVFLTGDACHTHSPKAGQGMNVSLQDGYNIGWKLAHVLKGHADPKILETYVNERRETAVDLIEFDREWTKLWASRSQNFSGFDPEALNRAFITSARYTAGLTAKYRDSPISAEKQSRLDVALELTVGMRFPSTTVVRFCDAHPLHLVKALPADGRWRIIIFAGDIRKQHIAGRLQQVG
jgi:phenol 2-monooxygenase (NADPH)